MKQKSDKGIATVEALLALPIFMAFMLFFISYCNVALTEMRMQYAANQTAKELSQYFYVVYKFGLNYSGTQSNENVDKMLSSLSSLSDTITEDKGILNNVVSSIEPITVSDSVTLDELQTTVNNVKASFNGNNPIDMIKTLISSVKDVGTSVKNIKVGDVEKVAGNTIGAVVMTAISDPIARALFPKYISTDENAVSKTLKNWGIKEGLDGVDFAGTSFLLDGETIKVVVSYKIELLTLGFWDFDLNLRQVAVTRAWIGNSQ